MMMNHQPSALNLLEQVRGEHPALQPRLSLPAGNVLRTDHPAHIPRDLDLDFGEIELHRERVVEDQDPGIANGWPADSEGPTGMDTGHVLLLGPDPIHPHDVQTFEGLVELPVRAGHLFNLLLDHAPPLAPAQAPSYSKRASGYTVPFIAGEADTDLGNPEPTSDRSVAARGVAVVGIRRRPRPHVRNNGGLGGVILAQHLERTS